MVPAWKQWFALTALVAFFLCTHSGWVDARDEVHFGLARQWTGVDRAPEIPLTDADTASAAIPTAPSPAVPHVERPGAAMLALPWAIGSTLVEKSLAPAPDQIPVSVARQFFGGAACVAMALAAWLIYWICIEFGCRPRASQYAAMVFALSTLALPASARVNSSTFATPVLLAIVYGYQRLRSGYDRPGQSLMLGVALAFALLVHDLTLLLVPLVFALLAFQIRQIVAPRAKVLLLFGPFALGAIVLALYNAKVFGGALTGPGGQDIVVGLIERYTGSNLGARAARILAVPGGWRAVVKALVLPQEPILTARAPGLFAAMPQLVLAFFGILNLRYDPNTRRPMYVVVALIAAWTALLLGRATDAPIDMGDFLPVIALLCVLIGSFIEYHLMTLSGIVLKPAFWLFFLYLSLISAFGMIAGIMNRTASGPEPQRIVDVFGRTPKAIPRMLDPKSVGALLLPGLPNLPVTLPLCAIALALPFAIGRVLGGDTMMRLGPSTSALKRGAREGAPKPPSRRSDREKYEDTLKAVRPEEAEKRPVDWENIYADDDAPPSASPAPKPASKPALDPSDDGEEPPPSANLA
ncbi:MAG: hypothetical protein KJ042_02915 [Deltaproteobacteria bacterium]|nr:hypothetical protein [Deltaproteobacteria bacterium]